MSTSPTPKKKKEFRPKKKKLETYLISDQSLQANCRGSPLCACKIEREKVKRERN